MLAVFAFGAVMASTASAHRVWTVCQEAKPPITEPPAKYDNDVCNTQTKPLEERRWFDGVLPAGTKDKLEVVEVVAPGIQLVAGTTTITCKKVTLKEGTIENILVEGKGPTGRDKGTVEFSECTSSVAGCTVKEPIKDKGKETALVENTAGTKIYDMFAPEKWKEEATKALAEKIHPFAKIEQTGGTGCLNTEVEGDGVAAEIVPEGLSQTKIYKFPCPTTLTPVNLWNGVKEVNLTLKAFGVGAKECGEVKVALVSKAAWDVE
ncbi:MAG: hypothetical protein ACRDK7_08575 [Solirubrobacteraceae bacterium]